MLIETQIVRSKSDLVKEVQTLSVTKAVIYRNVDRKTWEAIKREHSKVKTVIIIT